MAHYGVQTAAFFILVVVVGLGSRHAAAAPASHTLDVKGVKIRYFVAGQGEPVVLIHGLHSSAAVNWMINGVLADLAKDHRVIALDLPGHGQSDKPADEKAYGRQIVADIVALMDQLQIKKAHIVGCSLGGMIAVKFLVMHPDRAFSGTIGGMGWLREGSRLARIWEQMPVREGSRTPTALIRTIGQFGVTEQDLRAIDVPVEVVVGANDPVERMYVAPLRPVRPDWPVIEIEEAGHMNCVVKPEFRGAIADWVRKQSRK
jgi:pimeloyl-ACP methyl ester carboxylesterase